MKDPAHIEAILLDGARKARAISGPFMSRLRQAVGLRSLGNVVPVSTAKCSKSALPAFKQYREADGKFYFKLVSAGGQVLLQSNAFESPKVAGQYIAQLQVPNSAALGAIESQCAPGWDEALVAQALHDLSSNKD